MPKTKHVGVSGPTFLFFASLLGQCEVGKTVACYVWFHKTFHVPLDLEQVKDGCVSMALFAF